MKAIRFEKFGGPEVLEYKDIEISKPGPKEVLVKNLSVGLNYLMFTIELVCILLNCQVDLD